MEEAMSEARETKIGFRMPSFGNLWTPRLTMLPNGWGVAIAEINQALAELMLEHIADNQRQSVRSSIQRFSDDMANDRWILTHQGIAFNEQGKLTDGQNRLLSVCETKSTIESLVFFGVGGDKEMEVTDTGKHRSHVDAAHVRRIKADKDTVATVAALYKHAKSGHNYHALITHSYSTELLLKYGDRARLVQSWFNHKVIIGVDRAAIRGAVLAALVCDYNPAMLERFVHVLCDKIPATEARDSAPRLLRNFITNNLKRGSTGNAIAGELYLKTCAAILGTADDKDVKLIRNATESPFIIPEHVKEC